MKTTYYNDFGIASASIKEHSNGEATLTIYTAGKRTRKKYKNKKNALSAWYRYKA